MDPAIKAEYNKQYYEERKEELRRKARERYAQKIGRPVGRKGQPPDGTSYKQKWLELLEKAAQAPQESSRVPPV